jgi:hypothetical protein
VESAAAFAPAEEKDLAIAFSQTPDAPRAFGYKTLWFAVKTSDPASVIDALAFGEATPANWETGLAAAYAHGGPKIPEAWAFVSPPIDGWVLAMSVQFPYPVAGDAHKGIGEKFDVIFSRLMKQFDDVQFFGSHRVVGFVTWARARNGEPVRIFGFTDGEVLANDGAQTAEEAQLGLTDLSGLSLADACDKIFDTETFPDEGEVVELAGLWSIDPSLLSDQDHPPGTGFVVRVPDDLTQ